MADTPDYLSMIDSNPDLKQQLVAIGTDALKSGKVAPQDAKAMAKNMGVKDLPEDDYLTKLLGPSASQNNYDFGPGPDRAPASAPMSSEGALAPLMSMGAPAAASPSPAAMPQVASAPTASFNQRKGRKDTNAQNSKTVQNTLFGAPEISSEAEALNNTPQFQAANKAVTDQDDQLDMLRKSAGADEAPWLRPFLGLVDAQTGTSMQKNYQPGGLSQADRQKLILQYGNDQVQRKMDMAKAIVDGFGKLKSGSQQTGGSNVTINNSGDLGAGGGLATSRTDALRLRVGQDFDNDPVLKAANNTTNSLTRAMSLLNGKTPLTQKNFALAQQDFINAMAQGGNATEGKVNREMADTLAGKLNDLSLYSGNIEDLRKAQPEVFDQLKQLISQVQGDYGQMAQTRTQEKLLNSRQMSDEGARKTAEDKADSLMKKYGPKEPQEGKKTNAGQVLTREQKIAALKAAESGGQ